MSPGGLRALWDGICWWGEVKKGAFELREGGRTHSGIRARVGLLKTTWGAIRVAAANGKREPR